MNHLLQPLNHNSRSTRTFWRPCKRYDCTAVASTSRLPPLQRTNDRLRFRNPDAHSSDASGYEGSWGFYLGGGRFSNFWKRDHSFTLTNNRSHLPGRIRPARGARGCAQRGLNPGRPAEAPPVGGLGWLQGARVDDPGASPGRGRIVLSQ